MRIHLQTIACVVASATLLSGSVACHDLSGTSPLPDGTSGPGSVQSPDGALALYRGTLSFVSDAFLKGIVMGGLLSDELQPANVGGPPLVYNVGLGIQGDFASDSRHLPEDGPQELNGATYQGAYGALQNLRAQAHNAIGFLAAYAPNSSPALRGHLYAMMGYAEVFLADLYCSGVPLSTVTVNGDYVYQPGSSTRDVYLHAAALFDTAIVLAGDSTRALVGVDSTRIVNLARVGKGRALLDLGVDSLVAAQAAVAAVPTTYEYQFVVNWGIGSNGPVFSSILAGGLTASDREGINGLPYRSSDDPRTQSDSIGLNYFSQSAAPVNIPIYFPHKYGDGVMQTPVSLADGREARLIEAEVALRQGQTEVAMGILNDLRQTYADTATLATIPSGLTPAQAHDTLFAERAAWLYVTGHRLPDLRRLIREDSRTQTQVFPTGPYDGGYSTYGTDVEYPIPSTERLNPTFKGCIDHGA